MYYTHEEYQQLSRERGHAALESDVVKYLLRSIGRMDLFAEVAVYHQFAETHLPDHIGKMDRLWHHPEFAGNFPMKIQVWPRQISGQEPDFDGLIKQMRTERPDLDLARELNNAGADHYGGKASLGVIVNYQGAFDPTDWRHDELVIIHNRPDWSKGRPVVRKRHRASGIQLAMHRAEPFIDDFADECRDNFAEEGSELYERMESNDDFRESEWDHDGR